MNFENEILLPIFFLKVALFEFIPRAKRISFWSRGYDFKIRFASQFQRLF